MQPTFWLMPDRSTRLRHEIMLCAKANGLPTDELWLMLIFRTEAELTQIARDLQIVVP